TQLFRRDLELDIVLQLYQIVGEAGLDGVLHQALAALRLFDFGRAAQQCLEVAIFIDQLGGSFDANTGHAGYIVDRISSQRLHVDDSLGRHAETLAYLVGADAAIFHGVQHRNAGAHQLHEVLVGGHDRDIATTLDCAHGVGGNQIVRFEAVLFDAGNIERLDGVADQRKLRHKLFRRRRTVRLVVLVDLVTEGLFAGVENDDNMRRAARLARVLQQFPQHAAEAMHGPDRQSVRWARERRQGVESPEYVARAVDQVDLAALDDGHGFAG